MALDKNSLNKVMLIGHLGADPEIRYTSNNVPAATLSVATNTTYRDKEGNNQDKTEWHRVVAFGKLAEIAENYLGKGKLVYIEGRLRTRQWEDRDGNTRYTTEVLSNTINMLGGKGSSSSGSDYTAQEPQGQQEQQSESTSQPDAGEVDDDLPF